MSFTPRIAMVLAAGLGLRMRPLTLDRPKALVEVRGRTLIDRTLDHLKGGGIKDVVVNTHHKANSLKRHLADRTDLRITFSDESEQLLETGGGVRKALGLLGDDPFLVLNSDTVWLDAQAKTFARMAAFWDDEKMDALLMMHPTVTAIGYEGQGDFHLDPVGRLIRREERHVAPLVFMGVQMLHPRVFRGSPDGPFSLNRIYDKAAEEGRLYGLRHEGIWMDVGSPAGLRAAELALEDVER